ncbi:MAG: hypothetical protein NTW56_02415, partial [Alphaproteobacteria bacterium]|nr:hypothetical protein [Alphaproteobacteria bacterium]
MDQAVSTIRDALHAPLESIPGIGPKTAALLTQAGAGPRLWDLLLHLPERFAARVRVEHPRDAPVDRDAILEIQAEAHRAARSAKGARYVEVRAHA